METPAAVMRPPTGRLRGEPAGMVTELLLNTSSREIPEALRLATSMACGFADASVPKRSCRSPSIGNTAGGIAPGD
jgi:hypothetical protein